MRLGAPPVCLGGIIGLEGEPLELLEDEELELELLDEEEDDELLDEEELEELLDEELEEETLSVRGALMIVLPELLEMATV